MRLSKTILGISIVITVVFAPAEVPDAFGQTVTFEHLLTQGVSAERRGDLDAAEDFYRQSLQTTNNDQADRSRVLPLHRLAVLNAQRKKFEESEQFFQKAVRLDGNNVFLLSDFAQLQFDRKQYRDAEIILKYAFLLEPENTQVLYNLGYSVALQQDRQTEGLRYLKLALGEPRALRELAMIYRILRENEQAEFAEQRAAQQEQRAKTFVQAPEPPSLEARKELYEQIKRELIRAKSLEFARELEKAGIKYAETFDAGGQTQNATVTALPSTEMLFAADAPTTTVSAPAPLADPFLAKTESTPTAASDPWTTANPPQMKALPLMETLPTIADALKPLPEAEERPRSMQPEHVDRRTRISNGPTAVPLPPIAQQENGGNRVLRTPPTLADPAASSQYPRYAEIGSKLPPHVAYDPSYPVPQNTAEAAKRQAYTSEPKPSGVPSFFDLIQPVNLVAIDGRRERETSAPTAPVPEKIDEVAVQALPAIAPGPERLAAKEAPSPNNVRRDPVTPFPSVAPSPESITSRIPTENEPKGKQVESVAVAKVWKEIAVEPYVYVENIKSPQPKEQVLAGESKAAYIRPDLWAAQHPSPEPVAESHAGNKLREKEEKAASKPSAVAEPPTTAAAEPKPKPVPVVSDPFLQQAIVERKEEPQPIKKEKEEIAKRAPAPKPVETIPPTKQTVAERPAPILEPPIVTAPSPTVGESKVVERQRVATPSPHSPVARKQLDRVETVRPVPSVSTPEPLPPQREEPAGMAQTPPSKVRIVNIVDLEPPPDNQPGFARSGNYGN